MVTAVRVIAQWSGQVVRTATRQYTKPCSFEDKWTNGPSNKDMWAHMISRFWCQRYMRTTKWNDRTHLVPPTTAHTIQWISIILPTQTIWVTKYLPKDVHCFLNFDTPYRVALLSFLSGLDMITQRQMRHGIEHYRIEGNEPQNMALYPSIHLEPVHILVGNIK